MKQKYISLREFCRVHAIGMGTVKYYVDKGVLPQHARFLPAYDVEDIKKITDYREKRAQERIERTLSTGGRA